MPSNVTEISGATQVDFYLGNYAYSDIAASMANLKFKLSTDLNKIFYKNAAGTLYKFMNDASGSSNIPNTRILYADADGAATSTDGFVFNNGNVGLCTNNILEPASADFTSVAKGLHIYNPSTTVGDYALLVIDGRGTNANGGSGEGGARIVMCGWNGGTNTKMTELRGGGGQFSIGLLDDDGSLNKTIADMGTSSITFNVRTIEQISSQNLQTKFEVRNTDSGTLAYSSVNVKGQGAEAILGAYSSTYAAQTEWQSKAVLSSTSYDLAIVGTTTNGVEIYSGGTASGDKSARFMTDYTRFLKGLMIGDDSDPVGCWLHVKSPNEASRLERTTISVTNTAMGLLVLKVTNTSGATTDGFGGGFRFDYQDTSTSGYISEIQGVRNGTGGDLVLACSTTGSDMQKRMIVKSQGHVLIGKDNTESWETTYKVIHLGALGSIMTDASSETTGKFIGIVNNAYFNATPAAVRICNDKASFYFQINGDHYWQSIGAAAPDVPFNFRNRMILTHYDHSISAGAQLGLGTITPMLNIGSTSGDLSNAAGIHIKSDITNNRTAFLVLEGDSSTYTTKIASILFAGQDNTTSNSKIMGIDYFQGVYMTTTYHWIEFNNYDDNFTAATKWMSIGYKPNDRGVVINPDLDSVSDFKVNTNNYQAIRSDAANDHVYSTVISNYNIYGETNLQPVYVDTDNGRLGYYAPP